MSAELWARDTSGVNRKFHELWAQDGAGVNRKLKELWANDGTGVNRKIFSSGIKCTVDSFYSAILYANPDSTMVNLSDSNYLRFEIFNAKYNYGDNMDEYQIRLTFSAPTASGATAPLVRVQGTWRAKLDSIYSSPMMVKTGFWNFQGDEQYSDMVGAEYDSNGHPVSTYGTFNTTLTYAPVSAGSTQWLVFGARISHDSGQRNFIIEFPWSGITWIPTGDQFTI